MTSRRTISPWIVILLALGFPARADACGGHSYASFYACLPGLTMVGLHAGFALAILAAFVERPFVTRAGVRTGALWFSLQANLISVLLTSVAGVVVMGLAWGPNGDMILFAWMAAALGLTTLVEHAWLSRKRDAEVPQLRWGWVLAGNLVSAAVGFAMPFLRSIFETDTYRYIYGIQKWRDWISLATWTGVAVVFVLAFTLAPRIAALDRRRGFEVVTPPQR